VKGNNMEKYYVNYVDGGMSREQEFKTKREAELFIQNFYDKPGYDEASDWIVTVYWGFKLKVEPTTTLSLKVS
jgi:hypothetical protein